MCCLASNETIISSIRRKQIVGCVKKSRPSGIIFLWDLCYLFLSKPAFKITPCHPSCRFGKGATDQTAHTLVHCSYFYLLSAVPCLLFWLEICWSSVSVYWAVGVRHAELQGSQDWCWEVTAFVFRHALWGTPLSLPSVSLNTSANSHTHARTRTS